MSIYLKWAREQLLTAAGFLVQRQGTHLRLRERVGEMLARLRPRPAERGPATGGALVTDGYQPVDIVGPSRAAEIRAYFERFQITDHYGRTPGFFWPADADPGTHFGHSDEAVILNAPHVLAIANDPCVPANVSYALGTRPIISNLIAW